MFPPDPTPPGGYPGPGPGPIGKIKRLAKLADEMRELLREVQEELEGGDEEDGGDEEELE